MSMSVTHIPSSDDTLIITASFPTCSAEVLFEFWIQPYLLIQWWPQVAEVEPRLGGAYHLSWPQRNWHLRGWYTLFEPGKKLAFSWQWDHHPVREDVIVTFEPLEEQGTTLTIVHGPYDDSKQSQEDRQGHIGGWLYFLARLQNLAEK